MKVLVVDDHEMFAQATTSCLTSEGIEVLAIATGALDSLNAIEALDPDVVLMDLRLGAEDGIEVGKRMVQAWPQVKVVIVSALDDGAQAARALREGLHGYITKDAPLPRLIAMMENVLEGELEVATHVAIPRYRVSTPTNERDAALLIDQLTERERAVLEFLMLAAETSEIATNMAISSNTVRSHIQSILTKLQVHSRLEAVAFAVRYNVVDVREEASLNGSYDG
jgi:two-component system, NarL family, nitrate/nitrite response regulator NarL